jgi:predicted LPLAT superfamily acyltransferase
MNIRPCLIVPVFNHKEAIGATVMALRRFRLPMYLVNDGSDAATRERLIQLAAHEPLVTLLHLPENRGKGAAVMQGLRQAHADGYTHGLQIDADGQHDAGDVPKFIAAAAASPKAVVCGQARYDDSVPKARRYGRYITHFWVWVETLSVAIKDSMCGFRVYPLASTVRVMDSGWIPTRMDFDTVVMVRLSWAGVPVINIPTQVKYPKDGISHFRMWRDNVRISVAHSRLCAGMLLRLPALLWRRLGVTTRPLTEQWWRLAERGSYLGMLAVYLIYRLLGRAAARALLYPITAYFFLTGRRARRASAYYLRRLYAYAGPTPALPRAPTWRDSWRHQLAFAEASLDKVVAWRGRIDHAQVDFPNRAELDELLARGRGAVLIGAHLGNWEMARALAAFSGYRTINAVVYTEHARRFNRLLEHAHDGFRLNLIPIATIGPDTAIGLQEKIDRGELLMIVGDRTPPRESGRVTRATFLGHPAPFAQGPFILAGVLGCPVYLFFCLNEGGRYRIHFEHFCARVEWRRGGREQALRGYVQRFAQRLEHYCHRTPHQWFNFYDFWGDAVVEQPTSRGESEHELNQAKTRHV